LPEKKRSKVWIFIKWAMISFTVWFTVILVAGFFMPFEDRQGVCTVCGMQIYEKKSSWLNDPIHVARQSRLSGYYKKVGLPDHEHNWEYMGGVVKTNLYGIPARYDFLRSDPLLIVPQYFILNVLERLEKRNAQIELLRALNSTDIKFRDDVRAHLYESCPGQIERFFEWWEIVMTARQGEAPSDILPGPVWDHRLKQAEENKAEGPISDSGVAHVIF